MPKRAISFYNKQIFIFRFIQTLIFLYIDNKLLQSLHLLKKNIVLHKISLIENI
jgi:hypothetical protein